jgi:transposase
VKTHRVRLTADERQALEALVTKGRAAARRLTRARVLLKADEGAQGPGWTDEAIAAALDVSAGLVERLRKRAVAEGPLTAIERRQSKNPPRRKLDGRQEAQLIALSCSAPPDGREGWTLRLLADTMVELEYVDLVSYETVRRVLKKTRPAILTGGEATFVVE